MCKNWENGAKWFTLRKSAHVTEATSVGVRNCLPVRQLAGRWYHSGTGHSRASQGAWPVAFDAEPCKTQGRWKQRHSNATEALKVPRGERRKRENRGAEVWGWPTFCRVNASYWMEQRRSCCVVDRRWRHMKVLQRCTCQCRWPPSPFRSLAHAQFKTRRSIWSFHWAACRSTCPRLHKTAAVTWSSRWRDRAEKWRYG